MLTQDEIRENIKLRDVLLHIREVVKTPSGRHFVKYLFESMGVNELPELGLTGEMVHERLGLTRAANAIFSLISQADHTVAAQLLAEIEKEKYNGYIEPDTRD